MPYPIDIDKIIEHLYALGVKDGDSLFIHSSLRSLYYGASTPGKAQYAGSAEYVRDLIRALLDVVGPDGVLMMPTEFVGDYMFSSLEGEVLDIRKAGSSRGYLTQALLNWPGAVRSAHPVYNVVTVGQRLRQSVLRHHTIPYSMDRGSPWWEFSQIGGKIVYLGANLESNSFIHMPEYVMKNDYPRPVFFNRPHSFTVIDANGESHKVEAWVHAIRWKSWTVSKFCNYLQIKHDIFRSATLENCPVIVVSASEQYDALMSELEMGISWYDAIGWI